MADNYFGAIVDLSNKFKALDINVLINTILSRPEFKKLIIQLNTKGQPTSQLFELNVDSTGVQLSSIGGDYSPFTLEKAREEGRPKKGASNINLYDTGEYYDSFKVDFPSLAADYFLILSNPQKDETNLEDDWGQNLEGLTEKNLELLQEKILEELPQLIFKSLQ